MKRLITRLMAIVMCICLVACANQEYTEQVGSDQYFDAEVLEIQEDSLLVSPIGGKDAPSAAEVIVSTEVYSTNQVPDVEVGTNIRIMYGGEITESEPAQVETVFAIYLLDEIENTQEMAQTVIFNDEYYYICGKGEATILQDCGLPTEISSDLSGDRVAYLSYDGNHGYSVSDKETDIELFSYAPEQNSNIYIVQLGKEYYAAIRHDNNGYHGLK